MLEKLLSNKFMRNLAIGAASVTFGLNMSGCPAPSTSRPSEDRTPPPITGGLIKNGTTDSNGRVRFIDKQTGETVTIRTYDVLDKLIEGIRVQFWDGDGFEGFIFEDPSSEYRPTLRVYPTNSIHSITMFLSSYEGRSRTYDDADSIRAFDLFVQETKKNHCTNRRFRTPEQLDVEDFVQLQLVRIASPLAYKVVEAFKQIKHLSGVEANCYDVCTLVPGSPITTTLRLLREAPNQCDDIPTSGSGSGSSGGSGGSSGSSGGSSSSGGSGSSGSDAWADVVLGVSGGKDASNGLGKADTQAAVIERRGDYIDYGFTDVGAIRGPGPDIRLYFRPASGKAFVGLFQRIQYSDHTSNAQGGEQIFSLDSNAPTTRDIDLDAYPKFEGQLDEIVTGVFVGNESGIVKLDAILVINKRRLEDFGKDDSGGSNTGGDRYADEVPHPSNGSNALGAPDGKYVFIGFGDQLSANFLDNIPTDGAGNDIIIHTAPCGYGPKVCGQCWKWQGRI